MIRGLFLLVWVIRAIGRTLTNSTAPPPEAAVAAPRLYSQYRPVGHVRVLSRTEEPAA
jgi:hypothetical protein